MTYEDPEDPEWHQLQGQSSLLSGSPSLGMHCASLPVSLPAPDPEEAEQ